MVTLITLPPITNLTVDLAICKPSIFDNRIMNYPESSSSHIAMALSLYDDSYISNLTTEFEATSTTIY